MQSLLSGAAVSLSHIAALLHTGNALIRLVRDLRDLLTTEQIDTKKERHKCFVDPLTRVVKQEIKAVYKALDAGRPATLDELDNKRRRF
jgi:hypothetical protein